MIEKTEGKDLVARCGLYCGDCYRKILKKAEVDSFINGKRYW